MILNKWIVKSPFNSILKGLFCSYIVLVLLTFYFRFLTMLKNKIVKIFSQFVLIPYHWYCVIKKVPSIIYGFSYRKPTNKEFIQQYNNWLRKQSRLNLVHQKRVENSQLLPKFGVLIVVTHKNLPYLHRTLRSIKEVKYPGVEVAVCLVSNEEENKELLIRSCGPFLLSNVRVYSESVNNEADGFNKASSLIDPDYFMCIKSGDLLESRCLTLVANEVLKSPNLDIVYFDEGKVNAKGIKHIPTFKPQWSPDLLLSHNYLGYGLVFRSSTFRLIGKFDICFTYSYLYDALLKLVENGNSISHIPEVLYHKKSYFLNENKIEEEIVAIENALLRRGEVAKVLVNDSRKGIYHIRYELNEESKVSIIIPSRDKAQILDNCLSSIYTKTNYRNFEIIIVDNGSTETEFFNIVDKWKLVFKANLKLVKIDIPFNFARINNLAVKEATGDYVLFLNNDVEVLSPDWLTGMLEQAQRKSTGAVGAKLLFPNNEIQHAGVLLGVDGISSHPFARSREEDSHYYVNSIVNYSVLTGACLMVKKSVFEGVRGFDEDFVIEFNDFDLCLKLVNAGYNNVYLPHVVLYHYESYSRGKKHKDIQGFMRYRNERSLFLERWGDYIENDPSYNSNLHKDSDQIFKPKLD